MSMNSSKGLCGHEIKHGGFYIFPTVIEVQGVSFFSTGFRWLIEWVGAFSR